MGLLEPLPGRPDASEPEAEGRRVNSIGALMAARVELRMGEDCVDWDTPKDDFGLLLVAGETEVKDPAPVRLSWALALPAGKEGVLLRALCC